MKKILGLDLGTTSIGWAYVHEAENRVDSKIIQLGVRVNPLTIDEQTNFEKGKPITTNADRTLKRGMRRNLDRYQLRRDNLLQVLFRESWIDKSTTLAEIERGSTHSTYAIRAKAATEKIELVELARVLLAINKKRGYKSNRKSKNNDEGQIIDGMAVAKKLYDQNITPGQLCLQILKEGKKFLPDFYRSDLVDEFNRVWQKQSQYYPEIFSDSFKKDIEGKGQRATAALFSKTYNLNTAENKGERNEKKFQAYQWRAASVNEKIEKEVAAYVITEINNDLSKSSGYLGSISDRSKELYFNRLTVGQYQYNHLKSNPHAKLKNQVFYRQDYMDEFETLWTNQSKFHPQLTNDLKAEIRDIIIFYQRKLKSQRSLIALCEFEQKEVTEIKNGSETKRTIGLRVCPRSSPLFQEFKIWQVLQNLEFKNKLTKERRELSQEAKMFLFEELNIKGNLKADEVIRLLGYLTSEWELNYREIQGNATNQRLYEAYLQILEIEGYDVKVELKEKLNKDEIKLSDFKSSAIQIKEMVQAIFRNLGINPEILDFKAELDGKAFELQASYKLWHLLYSYEDDDSNTGNEHLYKLLQKKFGFTENHSKILSSVSLLEDFGNLSAKAIRNMYPFIKENGYDQAAELAGYRHSKNSLTRGELANRETKPLLDLLKKNSLRNPVVEKILNQMVNVINSLIKQNSIKDSSGNIIEYFKFDEIRIELARELKKNAKERAEMTTNIEATKRKHDAIIKILQDSFNIKNPSRNDIIKYKLYEELKNNGYKDLYTDKYIAREKLFTKDIDIEHIIPQSKLFDDSYSNKTLCFRQDNLDKGNQTAHDYILNKFGKASFEMFKARVEQLFILGNKNSEDGISKAKMKKLLMPESEIGQGFIERDLRDSQYIAKKAKSMLFDICNSVVSTSGSITDKLRKDWGLINIMQELNFDKYKVLGLTELTEKKDGSTKERIVDWTKRNDHRHHTMDALTVAFTKQSYIQYLNYLNARKNEGHKLHNNIVGIENKEMHLVTDDRGIRKLIFKEPILNFRKIAKEKLEGILVSHKAKNKVVTRSKNKIKTKIGTIVKIELTPRGQLHKESIYGKYHYYENKEASVNGSFDLETINKVSNPLYREALRKRLAEFNGDPKKAFTGRNTLDRKPIYLNLVQNIKVPERVKLVWLETDFSIRKDITPDNFKEQKLIDKIIDKKVREILSIRLIEHGGNFKSAFSNLDKNPIWLNKESGISIKRVTVSGVKKAEPLHYKRDVLGNEIINKNGNPIPTDYVSTGNNHHVAIYRDVEGKLQEQLVSFFEAVIRAKQGFPIIDKLYNNHLGWQFLFTMKQNEMFVFPNKKNGFNPSEIDLFDPKNAKEISQNLYRVQKITSKDYFFRHHLETNVDMSASTRGLIWKREGLAGIDGLYKIRLNHLGQVAHVGEY